MGNSILDLSQSFLVAHWCDVLHCDEGELREAVSRVGARFGDVRGYLCGPSLSLTPIQEP